MFSNELISCFDAIVFPNNNGLLMKTLLGIKRVEKEEERVGSLLGSNEKVLWIQPGRAKPNELLHFLS